MKARRSRSTLFLAAFIALAHIALNADDGAQSMRSSLARSRLRAALALEAEGKAGEANALLKEAVDLDGSYSDALYAQALRSPSGPARFSLVDRAVSSGRWDDRLLAERAALELAGDLVLRGDFIRAEGILASASATSVEVAYLACRSAFFSGKKDLYATRIDDASLRHPDDPLIARFFLERADPAALSLTDKRVLKRILTRLSALSDKDGELRILASPFVEDGASRRNVIRAALASGEKGRRAMIAYLEEGLIASETAIEAFFDPGLAPPSFDEALSLYGPLKSPEGAALLSARLSAYSGIFVEDARGDGYPELRAEYSGGEIMRSSHDANQDYRFEIAVDYIDGAPQRLTEEAGVKNAVVSYVRYPEADKVEVAENGTMRLYEIGALSFSYPRISFQSPFIDHGARMRKPALDAAVPELEESKITQSAIRLRETYPSTESAGGYDSRVTTLRDGLRESMDRFKGSSLVERVEFRKGEPLRARRDADGDGRFETLIWYPGAYEGKKGLDHFVEYRVDIDYDGDSVPDYREEGFPLRVKSWDYDSDGLFDSREEIGSSGTVTRSFSSALNGVMDVTVVFERGEPRAVTRNRTRLKVIQEGGKPIFWIGRKPFDIGASLPSTDGLHDFRGQRFLLFRVGGSAMLEPLP